MRKIISIFEQNFWVFELPEGYENAEEAHPTEGWYNLLDGPCENPQTKFIGFVDAKSLISEILDVNFLTVELEGNQFNWHIDEDEAERIFNLVNEITTENVEIEKDEEDVFIYIWWKIIGNVEGERFSTLSTGILDFTEDKDFCGCNTAVRIIEKMVEEQIEKERIEIKKNVEVDFEELIDFINSLESYSL